MTPGSGSDDQGRLLDDADLGEPIAELVDVSWPLNDQFTSRVRGRIERRVLGGSLLELLWTAPVTMLLEFLRWSFDRLADRQDRGER